MLAEGARTADLMGPEGGAPIGTALGVLYGWAGTRALLGTYAAGAVPQLPWLLLTAVVLAAAAVVASTQIADGLRQFRLSDRNVTVKGLAERYAMPLPKLEEEVDVLAARVATHLKAMGAAWT